MVKVLVTGGTGHIGRALIKELQAGGHQVSAFVRASSDRALVPRGAEIVEGDLFKIETLYEMVERVDVVIHVAGDMDFFPKDPAALYKCNVEGTRNLAKASAMKGVRRFIFISSTEVYGPRTTLDPINEVSPTKPVFDYGKSKVIAENSLKDVAFDSEDMDYVILRPCGIFNDTTTEYQILWAASMGLFFFTPGTAGQSGTCTWMLVEDCARGIASAVTCPAAKNETITLAGDSMTYEEMLRVACPQLGRVSPFVALPLPIVRLAIALLGPILRPVFAKRFAFEPVMVDQMNLHRRFNCEKAKEILGFEPKLKMKEALVQHINKLVLKRKLTKYAISPVAIVVLMLLLIFVIFFLF